MSHDEPSVSAKVFGAVFSAVFVVAFVLAAWWGAGRLLSCEAGAERDAQQR